MFATVSQAKLSGLRFNGFRAISCLMVLLSTLMLNMVQASEWRNGAVGFDEAKRIAGVTGKPVILYFRTDWCGYCKKFEQEVLSDIAIRTTMTRFSKVRVNPDDDDASKALAKHFGVKGYPHFLVLLPDGSSHKLHHPKGSKQESVAKFNDKLQVLLDRIKV